MKAIKCKYHPATDTKGSRISAWDGDNRVYITYPHDLSGADVFAAAALKLARKMGWTGTLVSGGLPDCEIFVFVTAHGHDCDKWEI